MEPILKHNVIEDSTVVYDYLDKLPIEYRKQYKGMYGRTMSVPRGQASFEAPFVFGYIQIDSQRLHFAIWL